MGVIVEQRDGVLIVAMSRPEKRNAIDRGLALDISAALDRLDDDPDLWVGILTGTPEVFSAGTDLRAGTAARTDRGGEYGLIRPRRQKPLVAAVEGLALGGGMEIALACDLIVASRRARFALPETRRGVIPSSGALFRAPRALPVHIAKQMMLTGADLPVEWAYELGLVNVIAEPGQAVSEALGLAAEICSSAPVAVQAVLAAVNAQCASDDEIGWRQTAVALDAVTASEDVHEGIAAFFDRRTPAWRER